MRARRSSIATLMRGSSSTISASCSRACRPHPWADLPKVLELAKRKNAVIKITGACTLSREPYPFPDIWDPLARVFDAWGFDRCLWGTDWTRAFAVVNYEQAVEPFLNTDRLSASERAMLMGGATAKAYGWSPKKT
jgi:L-fuconolactonase